MNKKWIILPVLMMSNMVWACATCFGAPDAPETHGMNGAIITLLVVTGGVLSGVVGTVFSLKKKARNYFENQYLDDLGNISK